MKREIRKSRVSRLIILIVLYFLQGTVFSRLRIFGAAALPLPLFAVCIGLFFGGVSGGCWGLASGLLCDLSLGGLGLTFTLYLTAAGFFSGFLCEFFLARGFPSFLLISVCCLIFAAFLQSFGYIFFLHCPILPILRTGLIQTLYSSLFILPVYLSVRHTRLKSR